MPTSFEPDDFPIIGEPLPVEFANSLYSSDGSPIDFLASPDLIRRWFALAAPDIDVPRNLRRADTNMIRDLRDAVHTILGTIAAGQAPPAGPIAALNRHAARSPWFLRLDCEDAAGPNATRQCHVPPIDALLGRIANDTIDMVAGPARVLLRRCNGPGCAMLFVKNHHKRRWCHPSCGHRARQANYYRRKRIAVAAV